MSEQNKDVVRKIEAAWNGQRLDELDQYFAPDFNNRQSAVPGLPPGLEGSKMAHQASMQTFPDRKIEILDMVAEGDKVFLRARVTGSNTGGFPPMGVGPNGRQIDIESWSVYRLKDDKVVEHVGLNDAFTLAMQLGAIPAPAG